MNWVALISSVAALVTAVTGLVAVIRHVNTHGKDQP